MRTDDTEQLKETFDEGASEMRYAEAEAYINQIQKFAQKNTLAHTSAFLKALDAPCSERKIIHVAGTNGKGSVCQYLNQLLQESGHTVGFFSSPHLVQMRERIAIGAEMVSKETFAAAFARVKQVYEDGKGQENWYHPTFFEYLFLMAAVIFEQADVEYVILETGMGGRLDATNVFPKPVLTIITEIGLDHCQYLGDTKEQIAYEKAGIIKEKVPLVYVQRQKEVTRVLSNAAKEKGAEAFAVDLSRISNINIKNKSIDFSYKSRYYNTISFSLSTTAYYQLENAVTALTAYEVLFPKEEIEVVQLQRALRRLQWAGRMEEIAPHVFVDGAHNEDGIAAFLDSVRRRPIKGRRILLFSVVCDKDYHEMIDRLAACGLFETYVITGISDRRGLSGEQLRVLFEKVSEQNIITCEHVREAYQTACQLRKQGDEVYIVGSLYLAGEIKALSKED